MWLGCNWRSLLLLLLLLRRNGNNKSNGDLLIGGRATNPNALVKIAAARLTARSEKSEREFARRTKLIIGHLRPSQASLAALVAALVWRQSGRGRERGFRGGQDASGELEPRGGSSQSRRRNAGSLAHSFASRLISRRTTPRRNSARFVRVSQTASTRTEAPQNLSCAHPALCLRLVSHKRIESRLWLARKLLVRDHFSRTRNHRAELKFAPPSTQTQQHRASGHLLAKRLAGESSERASRIAQLDAEAAAKLARLKRERESKSLQARFDWRAGSASPPSARNPIDGSSRTCAEFNLISGLIKSFGARAQSKSGSFVSFF